MPQNNHILLKHSVILNIASLLVYFYIYFRFIDGHIDELLFFTPDSRSYLEVSNWLLGNTDTQLSASRPILYPLFLIFSSALIQQNGIWLFQSVLWILTINLTFRSIVSVIKNYWFAYFGAAVLISNLTFFMLVFNALTEILCVFLIALLVHYFNKHIDKRKGLRFIHTCILLLALLTILKPVFIYPFLFTIILILPVFYFKKYRSEPSKIVLLCLVLSPVIIQMSIVKMKHDSFCVSNIAASTFDSYLLAQGLGEIKRVSRYEAVSQVNKLTRQEKLTVLLNNKSVFIAAYFFNLKENIKAHPVHLAYPNEVMPNQLIAYMIRINQLYFYGHILMFFVVLGFIIYLILKKLSKNLIIVCTGYLLAVYLIFSSGISFWQGDRLVLPSMAIWVVVYTCIIAHIVNIIKLAFRSVKLTI